MANILNIGVSALQSFQRALSTTGHNVANVDTPGYSRQRAVFATQTPQLSGSGWIGSGVKAVKVERIYDAFLASQVRSGQSVTAELAVYSTHAAQLDQLFADSTVGLDPALQNFFNAAQELANAPASISARELFLSESESLANRFHYLDRQLNDARGLVKAQIEVGVGEINSISGALARLNGNIVQAIGASSGKPPNDLLDQREALLGDLSKLVDINTVEQDDGALNVFIGKGQTLVIASKNTLLESRASDADISELEIAIQGSPPGQSITSQLSGGSMGGLLGYKGEILDPTQNQLGLIAAGLAETMNAQHRLGIDLDGNPGGAFFSTPTIQVVPNADNAGGRVTAAYSDVTSLTASDYELRSEGGNIYTLTRQSDGSTTSIDTGGAASYTSADIDGFTLTINVGAAAGDTTLIRPTRTAASNIQLQLTDVRRIAAAAPLRLGEATDANGLPTNTGNGIITQPLMNDATAIPLAANGGDITLSFDAANNQFTVAGGPAAAGPLAYDPASDSGGKSFTLFGFDITVSGDPDDTDAFVIGDNSNATGDNRNALRMAGLQQHRPLLGGNASMQEAYGQLVADIGTKTRHSEANHTAQQGLLEHSQAALASLSGVNLDEEAANLIKFQQAYQAAAQMISVSNTLFDSLISAVRR